MRRNGPAATLVFFFHLVLDSASFSDQAYTLYISPLVQSHQIPQITPPPCSISLHGHPVSASSLTFIISKPSMLHMKGLDDMLQATVNAMTRRTPCNSWMQKPGRPRHAWVSTCFSPNNSLISAVLSLSFSFKPHIHLSTFAPVPG